MEQKLITNTEEYRQLGLDCNKVGREVALEFNYNTMRLHVKFIGPEALTTDWENLPDEEQGEVTSTISKVEPLVKHFAETQGYTVSFLPAALPYIVNAQFTSID